MKRRLTQFLFALGLLLTLASAGVFVRGAETADAFSAYRTHDSGQNAFVLYTGRQLCAATWSRERRARPLPIPPPLRRGWTVHHLATPARQFHTFVSLRGAFARPSRFHAGRVVTSRNDLRGGRVTTETTVAAPTWFIGSATAALSAGAAWPLRRARRAKHERRRRAARGLCLACGYDLGGANHDRCPECGAGVDPQPV